MNPRAVFHKSTVFMCLLISRSIAIIACLVILDIMYPNQSIVFEIWPSTLAQITPPILIFMFFGFPKIEIPAIIECILGFIWYTFVLDSLFTLHHYVMHSNTVLYSNFHYVHHSGSGVLNTQKGLLSHPVDGLSVNILVVFWILTVEPNIFVLSLAYSMLSIWGILLHTGLNNEIRVWRFLVSPMDHQNHHTCVNVNYAGFYSIWDRLFDTYSNNCK